MSRTRGTISRSSLISSFSICTIWNMLCIFSKTNLTPHSFWMTVEGLQPSTIVGRLQPSTIVGRLQPSTIVEPTVFGGLWRGCNPPQLWGVATPQLWRVATCTPPTVFGGLWRGCNPPQLWGGCNPPQVVRGLQPSPCGGGPIV